MVSKKSESQKLTTSNTNVLERLDSLEKTVQTLQSKSQKTPKGPLLKRVAVYILVFLCAIMINLTAVSLWLKRTIVDTDIWTQKTSALLQNESVQSDVATKITDEILIATNAEQLIAENLPPRLAGLQEPLTSNLERFVGEKISTILSSERFKTFWENANTSAHSGIISSLENNGQAPENTDQYVVYINDDKLLLNLKPIIQNIQTELTESGLGFVGNINTSTISRTVTLTEIQSLPTVLATFNFINKAAPLFGILAVLFGAGALALSQKRRKTVVALCVSIIALMVLNVQALYLAQYQLAQQLKDALQSASTATGSAVYTILTSDLVALNRLLMISSLIILIVALLSGPGKSAVAFRRFINRITTPKNASSFINSVAQHKTVIISVLALLSAVLIIFPPISGQLFPLTVITIASVLCLWVYSLEPTPKPASKSLP